MRWIVLVVLAAAAIWFWQRTDGDVSRSAGERESAQTPEAARPEREAPAAGETRRPSHPSESAPAERRTVSVEVVDAETGAALSGISVIPSPAGARTVDSPIDLPVKRTFGLSAEGYLPTTVDVPGSADAPVRVELMRAAALVVHLLNRPPGVALKVTALLGDHKQRTKVAAEEGPTELRGIPAGDYTVLVEAPRRFRAPLAMGRATATVAAGARAVATITLSEAPPPGVPFSGTLEIPASWGAVSVSVSATTRDGRSNRGESLQLDGGNWTAGLVPPGRYYVAVRPFGMQFAFDVAAPGVTGAVIRIPELAEVTVLVTDESGRPIAADAADVDWYAPLPKGSRSWSPQSAKATDTPGRFRFRAPATTIVISADGDEYDADDRKYRLHPGANDLTVRLRRVPALRVRFRRDGKPADRPSGLRMQVKAVGHEGNSVGWKSSERERVVTLSAPGRYRATFRKLEGFRAIPPRELDIARGITDLVIELQTE